MKAYLINPFERTVTEVDVDLHDTDTWALIDSPPLEDSFKIAKQVLLIDRLMYSRFLQDQAYFMIGNFPKPLGGKALMYMQDGGLKLEPTVEIEKVEASVRWLDREEVRKASDDGVFDKQSWKLGDLNHETIKVRIPERPENKGD